MSATTKHGRWMALAALILAVAACDEANPFRGTEPFVRTGSSTVWELDLAGFPSAFDFAIGTRFFVGTTPSGTFDGAWVLDARSDGTLVFRPFSTLVPGLSLNRTGIRDMGPISFDGLTEAPGSGYSDASDSTGVPVVQGHVYAFRVSRLGVGTLVPVNYGKLEATRVDRQFPDDPSSRFVEFRWAYQLQPQNRSLVVEEE